MRIALVSPSFLPDVGGAEFVAHNLAMAWGRQGHTVQVLNWVTDRPSHPDATYSVARFSLLRGAPRFGYHRFPFLGYTVRQLERAFSEFRPDFVSGHMGYPTGPYLAGCRPRVPFSLTCHGRDLTHFDWGYRNEYGIDQVMRGAMLASQGVIAISSYARRVLEELGLPVEKIHDIPNGVDLERFARPMGGDVRDLLGIPADTPLVLSVGREHPQKAFAAGIRAFALAAGRRPDAPNQILGKGTEANRPLIESLGLEGRVHTHPGLQGDELVGAYRSATVYFSPSVWEMMPLVVLESMAAGIPAVVTNVSGSQDLIVDGKTGFIVEAGDEESMADRLTAVLEDAALRSRLAKATSERVIDYGWDHVARRHLELAETLH